VNRPGPSLPLLASLALLAATPIQARAADAACGLAGVARVVAVGDVHGAHDNFVAVLRMAGLVDAKERWSGGKAHLVQTGDVLDRGPHSRKSLDLLMRLEKEARKAGGRVHALLGNHEVMNMQGDLRFVSAEEYEAFRTPDSEALRERSYQATLAEARERGRAAGQPLDEKAFREGFLARTPLGYIEHRRAFGPQGEYGRWLRRHDTVAVINGVAFLHGGLSPAVAPLGCGAINDGVRRELADGSKPAPAAPGVALATHAEGPLWYRGLAQADEASFGPSLDAILQAFGVRAVVVAHTVTGTGRVESRFAGRVVMIDAGMLPAFGGHLAALEIGPEGMTALYPDGRVKLGTGPVQREEPRAAAMPSAATSCSNAPQWP
jgi:hypothetical protein